MGHAISVYAASLAWRLSAESLDETPLRALSERLPSRIVPARHSELSLPCGDSKDYSFGSSSMSSLFWLSTSCLRAAAAAAELGHERKTERFHSGQSRVNSPALSRCFKKASSSSRSVSDAVVSCNSI